MSTVVESKKAPILAASICLVLAWVFMLLPIPVVSGVAGWGLNLAAFILAIIVISRGRTGGGIVLMAATLIASPIVYFIGVVVLAAILDAGNGKANAEMAKTPAPASDTVEGQMPREAIAISSNELYRAYETNEIAADQIYKGKWLQVTGRIESIDSDMSDEPVVVLTGDGDFTNVGASGLPVSVAMNLSKGDSVTLNCVGGGEVMGSPVLDECELR